MKKITPDHLSRLLLGMKGTMSEMELSIFRQGVQEAELFGLIAVGYRKVAHEDRIEKEPDRRVQQAITLVFKKFARPILPITRL
jgi:hypothetical protein